MLIQPGEVCLGRRDGDARNQFYGWRAYGFSQIRQGIFPFWNPYEFLGTPFVASLQSAMFYPLNWLCAIMKFGRAINLAILIGLALSGIFTYLWCRRVGTGRVGGLIGALAYVLGAPQSMRIFEGHWSFLAPMSWSPCILLFAEMLARPREDVAQPFTRPPCGGPSAANSRQARAPAPHGFFWLTVAGGAAAVGLQLLAGNPQYAFYGGIAASLYFLGRLWSERAQGRRAMLWAVGGFAGMYLLGSLLACVQYIPALELLDVSARKGQLSLEWVAQYSLTPESLITLVAPDFFGSDATLLYWGRTSLWEMSMYMGAAVLALAAIGLLRGPRRMAALAGGIALLMLLLALGKYGPFLSFLYHWVPGFNLFRSLARFLAPWSLFVALLAALGVDALLELARGERETSRGLRGLVGGLAALAAVLALAGLALAFQPSFARQAWARFMHWMIGIGPEARLYLPYREITPDYVLAAMREAGLTLLRGGIFLGGAALCAWAAMARALKPRIVMAALLALVAVDGWLFARRYLVTFDPRLDGLTPAALAHLKAIPQPFRYARAGSFTFPQCEGMSNEICCLEGIQPNAPARFRDVFWTFQGDNKDTQRTSYAMFALRPPLRMLNLTHLVQYRDNPRTQMDGLSTPFEDERIRIDALPNPFPRAWLVHQYRVVPDHDRLLSLLQIWDYERAALFEEDPGLTLGRPTAPEPRPLFTLYEPNRVRIECRPQADAILMVSDMHFPGWRATLDGRPVPILRGNYLMRAVAVPSGEHQVEFVYQPRSFKTGAALSLIALALLGGIVGLHFLARRQRRGEHIRA